MPDTQIARLSQEYITLSPAEWLANETTRMCSAVEALVAGLAGDVDLLVALLGRPIALKRHRSAGLMGWAPSNRTIYLFDDLMVYSQETVNWVFAHEVGHIVEQTFASAEEFREATGGRWEGQNYILGDLPTTAEQQVGKWSTNADRHPAEDWADTFACLTINPTFVHQQIGPHKGPGRLFGGRGASPLREMYYQQVLNRARATISAYQELG